MTWREAGISALGQLPGPARRKAVAVLGRGPGRVSVPRNVQTRPRSNDLVFVLSLPRSGTNAFGGLLRAGYPSLTWEGELLFGHVRPQSAAILRERFPWVTAFEGASPQTHTQEQREAMHTEFRRAMNENAPDVISALLADREGPTVVKVFPIHLDRPALAALLAEHRPRIIDLRRRLLFSYVSYLKATSTGVWTRAVAPDSEVRWTDRKVAAYVARCDEWTGWCSDVVGQLDLETVRVSYEDLYETRTDLARLREFFRETPASDLAHDDDRWVPPTVIQDRRTDAALAQLMHAFSDLSSANRAALMRDPGD